LHPVRSFGAFLVTNGVLTENPAKQVNLPKRDQARRQVVTEEEIAALLQAVERQRNSRKIAFQRAVLSVLIYGGLRRQELLDLHTGDVDLSECSITVRSGKGQKGRRVYVCDDCIHALREWVAVRPAAPIPYLFAYDVKRRLHFNGLRSLLETVKATA